MKQTTNFNIYVPELWDIPDITQVSDAIQDLEDALAGTIEVMVASIDGTKVAFTSPSRTTKRTQYYEGMSIQFVAPIQISENSVRTMSVDNLPEQQIHIPYLINAGESTTIYYDGTKFIGGMTVIPKSASIDLNSNDTVATSLAVKTLNGNKAEKSTQVVAGNGLTGGGDLTTNRTLNVVSADDGIVVNSDNIKLNIVDSVSETSPTRPASASAVKAAYDKAESALQNAITAQESANDKVSKTGDTMTGDLLFSPDKNIVFQGSDSGDIIFKEADGTQKGRVYSDNGILRLVGGSNNGYFVDIQDQAIVKGATMVCSKGYCSDYSVSSRSATAFHVGDANGKPLYITNAGATFTKGYKIETATTNVGYVARTSIGHYRSGKDDFGSTAIFFEGDSAWQESKQWLFNHYSGDFISPGNVIAYSDVKLKKDLEVIPNALEKIQALNGYTYTRKDTGAEQTGVVAQEVQKVLPQAVTVNTDEKGEETLGVAYGNMVGLLIEGIKEQQNKIESLEERIERLERLLKVV